MLATTIDSEVVEFEGRMKLIALPEHAKAFLQKLTALRANWVHPPRLQDGGLFDNSGEERHYLVIYRTTKRDYISYIEHLRPLAFETKCIPKGSQDCAVRPST